jgi:hypothetical protein
VWVGGYNGGEMWGYLLSDRSHPRVPTQEIEGCTRESGRKGSTPRHSPRPKEARLKNENSHPFERKLMGGHRCCKSTTAYNEIEALLLCDRFKALTPIWKRRKGALVDVYRL